MKEGCHPNSTGWKQTDKTTQLQTHAIPEEKGKQLWGGRRWAEGGGFKPQGITPGS